MTKNQVEYDKNPVGAQETLQHVENAVSTQETLQYVEDKTNTLIKATALCFVFTDYFLNAKDELDRACFNEQFSKQLVKGNITDFEACSEFIKHKILAKTRKEYQKSLVTIKQLTDMVLNLKSVFINLTLNSHQQVMLLSQKIATSLRLEDFSQLKGDSVQITHTWFSKDRLAELDLVIASHQEASTSLDQEISFSLLVFLEDKLSISYAEYGVFGFLDRTGNKIDSSQVLRFMIVEELNTLK